MEVIEKGRSRLLLPGCKTTLSTGDGINLLEKCFTFKIVRTSGNVQNNKRRLENENVDRAVKSKDRMLKGNDTRKKKDGMILVGSPVKFHEKNMKRTFSGLVLEIDQEKSQAKLEVDGNIVWQDMGKLQAESTIMRIREEDIKKSMGEGKEKKKKEVRSTDRVTRSATGGRNVQYTEYSSDEDLDDLEEIEDSEEQKVKEERKRYRGTVLSEEMTSSVPTGVYYSDLCKKHYVPKWHYEKPERLDAIKNAINDLTERYPKSIQLVEDFKRVDTEDLIRAHSRDYVEKVVKMVPHSDLPMHVTQYTQEEDERDPSEDCDTFMSKSSWDAILIANGAIRSAIDDIHKGKYRNAFCAIRPPGHHCGESGHTEGATSQGYCIVNNVVLASYYAKDIYNYQRIAIVDFDVHHGNGTEELLGGKEGFLFCSIHAVDVYPHTGADHIVREKNVINVGLQGETTAAQFHTSFDEKILPALKSYQPDLLILSAGFDAHKKDPTEGLQLEEKDFFVMTEKLKDIAKMYSNGKMLSVLEGGYHLPSLRKSVKEHLLSMIKI